MMNVIGLALLVFPSLGAASPDAPLILGDRPGDVERRELAGPIGAPGLLPDGRLMIWSTTGPKERRMAVVRFSEDNGLNWSEPQELFQFPADKGDFSSGPGMYVRSAAVSVKP